MLTLALGASRRPKPLDLAFALIYGALVVIYKQSYPRGSLVSGMRQCWNEMTMTDAQQNLKAISLLLTGAFIGIAISGAVVLEYFGDDEGLEEIETVLVEQGSRLPASFIPVGEDAPQAEVGGRLHVPIYSTVYRGDLSA